MRYLMRAIVGALFLFVAAASPTALIAQPEPAPMTCAPVQNVIQFLEQRHLDYVIVRKEAVLEWRAYLRAEYNVDIDAAFIIVAFNPQTDKGIAMFAASGAICLTLDFALDEIPVKLHRS